jgi:hypothetical protein
MALGAVKILKRSSLDGIGLYVVDITGATSYTTGGDSLTPTVLGAPSGASILGVFIQGPGTTNTPLMVWDPALQTVKAYGTAAGATGLTECTAAGNFSTHTYRALVLVDRIG